MPSLSQHQSSTATKLLLIGDSGTGKTGALVSLVKAGFKLRVLDFDNGLDILVSYLRKEPNAEELLSSVQYLDCTDAMKTLSNGQVIPIGQPQAFSKAMTSLNKWPDEPDYKIENLGAKDIIVLDSLTFMAKAAYRYADSLNPGAKDKRQIFFDAQNRVEGCLDLLYSPTIKCNVIVTSHITYIELSEDLVKGYPNAIGKALAPKVPRFFNHMLQVKSKGSGMSIKRVITSLPDGTIDLKSTVPNFEAPIETGLADFFAKAQGNG